MADLPDSVRQCVTNNPLESFNGKLGERLGKHPRIDRLIVGLLELSHDKKMEFFAGARKSAGNCNLPDKREIIWRFDQLMNRFPLTPEVQACIASWGKP